MSNIRAQFGKPKLVPSTGPTIFRLKGEASTTPEIYRLLPAMKSGATDGTWAVYQGQHFGYAVPDRKDPSKTSKRTFRCIRRKERSGIITVECPECKLIDEKKAERETAAGKLTAKGKSDAEIKQLLAPLDEWLREHNVDNKWYIGVKSLAGPCGALAIPHKMKLALDKEIKRLASDEGVDAFDIDTGAWLHFKRTGFKAQDMNFSVESVMEEEIINGRRLKSLKSAPLSDSDLESALREVPDLKSEVIRTITVEQIQELVDSGGDLEVAERIFSSGRQESSPAPAPVVAAKPAPKAVVVEEEPEIELPKPPAPKAVASKPVPVVTTTPAKAAPSVTVDDNMSDEEFLSMFQNT